MNGKKTSIPWGFYKEDLSYPINKIDVTKLIGYSNEEIFEIEDAFEIADKGKTPEDYMFNGLVAVLEVLKEIHSVTDTDLLITTQKRFSDHYKSLSV